MTDVITWLRVEDVARSRRFYEEGLGARLVLEQGDCCILSVPPAAYLGLCTRPPPRDTPGLLLCFVEDDVDGRVDALLAAGATLEKAPADNSDYRIYHAFLRDPDGHHLEVQRFWDREWKGSSS